MINQNNHNIWIQQPLLAAEILWVEHLPWVYRVEFHQEGDKIEVEFQLLPSANIMASVEVVHNEPGKASLKEEASQNLTTHLGPIPTPNGRL